MAEYHEYNSHHFKEIDFTTDPDPAVKKYRTIFQTYFPVEVKAKYTYSDWQQNVSGIPITGNEEWDRATSNEYNTAMISIAQMADWVHDEIPFYFVNRWDIPTIHKHIENYIDMMVECFNREYISQVRFKKDDALKNVIQDLEKLADLANKIAYPAHRVSNFTGKPIQSKKNTALHGKVQRTRVIMDDHYKRLNREEQTKRKSFMEEVKHINIADNMSDQVRTGSRIWRKRGDT